VVGLFDYDNDNDNDSVPGISATTSVLIAPSGRNFDQDPLDGPASQGILILRTVVRSALLMAGAGALRKE